MQLTPENARTRLLDLFLARENYRQQLEAVESELRDVRNFIAGGEAVASAHNEPDETKQQQKIKKG